MLHMMCPSVWEHCALCVVTSSYGLSGPSLCLIGTHKTGKEEVDTILFIPGRRQAVTVQGLRVCVACVLLRMITLEVIQMCSTQISLSF